MIFHIMFKSRPKLCIGVLEDHGNNLVQEKDNNANGVDEMTSMCGISWHHGKASMFGSQQIIHEMITWKSLI